MQIQEECHKFGSSSRIKHTCVYGGVPKGPQVKDLRAGTLPGPSRPARTAVRLSVGPRGCTCSAAGAA